MKTTFLLSARQLLFSLIPFSPFLDRTPGHTFAPKAIMLKGDLKQTIHAKMKEFNCGLMLHNSKKRDS